MMNSEISNSFISEISKESGIASIAKSILPKAKSFFSSAGSQAKGIGKSVSNADKHLRIGGAGKMQRGKDAVGKVYRGIKDPANKQLRNALIGTGLAGGGAMTGYALSGKKDR